MAVMEWSICITIYIGTHSHTVTPKCIKGTYAFRVKYDHFNDHKMTNDPHYPKYDDFIATNRQTSMTAQ